MAGITLAQGSSVTLTLTATDSVLIDSGKTGSAYIESVSLSGVDTQRKLAHHRGGQATYGPFGAGTVKLAAVGGAIAYMQGTAPLDDEGGYAKFATDSNGNITSLVDGAGNRLIEKTNLPILIMGGDHALAQWPARSEIGKRYGLREYMAANSDSVSAYHNIGGGVDSVSWADAKALTNVELCSHGARHIFAWDEANTGIKFVYTGAAATATVYVTATHVVGVTAGAAADFSIALSGLTVSDLVAAVAALGTGWDATAAPELTGAELASNLLVIVVGQAKSAKSPTVAFMAMSGGITIQYTGTAYHRARVFVGGSSVKLYGDGRFLADCTFSENATLTAMETAINAVSGWTAAIMDSTTAGEGATTDNYISGGEASSNLRINRAVDSMHFKTICDAGVGHYYTVKRLLERPKEVAASNGVTYKHFAQSGTAFYEHGLRGLDTYESYRGSNRLRRAYPYQKPATQLRDFSTAFNFQTSDNYTGGINQLLAVIDALVDSGPFVINALCHAIEQDGTTGITLIAPPVAGSMTEAEYVAVAARIKQYVDAGQLLQLTPSEAFQMAPQMRAPANLLFNRNWITSGESLVGANSNGEIVPGWMLVTNAVTTAATVTDGVMSVTNNATTVAPILAQTVMLKPGFTYDIGVGVECATSVSGNGVQVSLSRRSGFIEQAIPTSVSTHNGTVSSYVKSNGNVSMRVTIPEVASGACRIISLAGPFDLSSNINIKVNLAGLGLTANINCAGSTPAATTAKEVAAAINAALAADANYPAEYHTSARAVAGRVHITMPYSYGVKPDSFNVVASSGSANDALTALFGSSTSHEDFGSPSAYESTETDLWEFVISASVNGSFKIYKPWIREFHGN